MGLKESALAMFLGTALGVFVQSHRLGIITGEAVLMRLLGGIVRIPDLAFIPFAALPNGRIPDEPIPNVVPHLVVEILSPSNTRREMDRKLQEYFSAGVRLVWIVEPATRAVAVHTGPTAKRTLTFSDTLDGGEVLPGFSMRLSELFTGVEPTA